MHKDDKKELINSLRDFFKSIIKISKYNFQDVATEHQMLIEEAYQQGILSHKDLHAIGNFLSNGLLTHAFTVLKIEKRKLDEQITINKQKQQQTPQEPQKPFNADTYDWDSEMKKLMDSFKGDKK